MSWIPLHVHSQYSILDATASVKDLVAQAKEWNLPALSLTDQGNLHGAVDFFKICQSASIHPILGCELYVAPEDRRTKKRIGGQRAGYPIVLLVKNQQGYKNLCKLSSLAYIEGFYYTPRIDKELLQKHHEGLICLSGPMRGRVADLIVQGKEEELSAEIQFYQQLFQDDYYLEMTLHTMDQEQMRLDGMDRESWLFQASLDYQKSQQLVCEKLHALSQELSISTVATNDSRYMERHGWHGQEALMNISSGEVVEMWEYDSQGNRKNKIPNPKRKVLLSHELYFKSPEQMQVLFQEYPDALAQTLEIQKKCAFSLDCTSKFYPVFVPPHLESSNYSEQQRKEGVEAFLRELCAEGVTRRYDENALLKVREKHPEKDPIQVVNERLDYELDLIISKGLCDYLLIVYDFINWAKSQRIPVGPGRGSGAGSIVCYLTGITDIEPLRFDLFFERFINPERISYPDIDVDICMHRRSEVIDYTIQKYGKDNVAQIITFGTMKAKMAVKDVGRVLSVPLSKVNQIAKLIPDDLNMTLDRALELDPELKEAYDTDEETHRLIDLARSLEGSVRNTGIHAAGLIVSADPLVERIPVCNSKDDQVLVSQFAMKPVEAVGMLKIDFLGLKTLTAIQLAADAVSKENNERLDWVNLPLDNGPAFQILNQGRTMGIFQLESGGMQELAKQLHIDKFEEIIAVGALYRPGPMEMIPSFIARKHGREPIEFDHPKMKDILAETYGIMVYQEQVMMMAQRLAGYSLGAGDVLRKAMGKKDHAEMARQRDKFRKGALENGITEEVSMQIFDKVEKFASYGFNKSHAAAYGYLSYVTAYLKANHTAHWMAALLTSDRDDISKVTKIIRECEAMHIPILSPDINESASTFLAVKGGIRFAMTAVKGIGHAVVEAIVEERTKAGPFSSLYDFISRIDTQKVGKKGIESLAMVGALDFTGWSRAELIASVEPMFHEAQKEQKEKARGELNFFSLLDGEEKRFVTPPQVEQLSKMEILKREKELLGFYLTGHPLDEAKHTLQQLSCVGLEHIEQLESGTICRVAFVIEAVQVKLTARTGKKFAILTIGDGRGRFEIPIWSDQYEQYAYMLIENQLLYAVIQADREEGKLRLRMHWFDELLQADEEMIRACDTAFDKARMQAKMQLMRKKNGGKKMDATSNTLSSKEKKNSTLIVVLDADQVKLSHILQLKTLFRERPGRTKAVIDFRTNENTIAQVEIDPAWGVEMHEELKMKILNVAGVIDILMHSS